MRPSPCLRALSRCICVFVCVRSQAWATDTNNRGGTPEQLSSPTNVVQVAVGMSHTVFVDASGAVRIHCCCRCHASVCFLVWLLVCCPVFGVLAGSFTAC